MEEIKNVVLEYVTEEYLEEDALPEGVLLTVRQISHHSRCSGRWGGHTVQDHLGSIQDKVDLDQVLAPDGAPPGWIVPYWQRSITHQTCTTLRIICVSTVRTILAGHSNRPLRSTNIHYYVRNNSNTSITAGRVYVKPELLLRMKMPRPPMPTRKVAWTGLQ